MAFGGLAIGGLSGCLPGDDRPEPGSLFVTAESSDATRHGFSTSDGWEVTFEHFFTAVGDISLEGYPDRGSDSCNDYADTHYEWLFDFTAVAAPQKVGLTYGLGTCSVEFRFRGPSAETVLGVGATREALFAMLLEASDPYADDQRAVVVVRGRGEKVGIEKRFEWVFRSSYELEKCPDDGGGFVSVVNLQGGDALTRGIEVRGEELFRHAPLDEAPLVFGRYALADLDLDGTISGEELVTTGFTWTDEDEWLSEIAADGRPLPSSLADLLYEHLLPRIARMRGSGPCESELRERNW